MKHGLMNRFTCMKCNQKFSIQAQVKQDELLENPIGQSAAKFE
jgi:transcription elongation factor Elf1